MPFFELVAYVIAGLLIGLFFGLVPGIHSNLLSAIMAALGAMIGINPLLVGTAIMSMVAAHCFSSFIPTIFLGAASEGTVLAAHPGNKLLLRGLGYDAVRLCILGGLLSILLTLILVPLLLVFVPFAYFLVSDFIWLVLVFLSIVLVLMQQNKVWAFVVFCLSAMIGFFSLNSVPIREPLLPMLSGFFGVSLMLMNLSRKMQVPRQYVIEAVELFGNQWKKPPLVALLCGAIVSLFPAIGPSQSSQAASRLLGKESKESFLVLVGGIDLAAAFMGLMTAVTIGKARNGSVAIVMQGIGDFTMPLFLLLSSAFLISACLAAIACIMVARVCARWIHFVDYKILAALSILIIATLTLIFSSPEGLFVLFSAAAVGVLALCSKVNLSTMMGSLMVPVILYYLL